MSAKECIKNARYKLGMTQREFAGFLGVNKASISLYETGDRSPAFPTIRKIVDKLKEKGIHYEYADFKELNYDH